MLLNETDFKKIIYLTPLISIDLVVINALKQVLLGYRSNRPALGYWFVPGGRIRKDESIQDAFFRLTLEEIGKAYDINDAKFLGVFEHFYKDNYFDGNNTTHYVVLGYELHPLENVFSLPAQQHSAYKWLGENEILTDMTVHSNTKAYFIK
jgi:colanic acid biosynthesis protein WcaH